MRRLPLRSPPRMRGKVIVRSRNAVQIGITPAYAGKSARILKRRTEKRDHPRVCGEKAVCSAVARQRLGSPPRMRGKASCVWIFARLIGITPACAGKSTRLSLFAIFSGDHPRVCGEKIACGHYMLCYSGSPPRVRGKADPKKHRQRQTGITPACAGKRECPTEGAPAAGDHPRVCGEKPARPDTAYNDWGSPPRVRGKEKWDVPVEDAGRITPACAGKSPHDGLPWVDFEDHPRVCGEKRGWLDEQNRRIGSPPRVRGKVPGASLRGMRLGITPACAGKSCDLCQSAAQARDHPRVCGEKFSSMWRRYIVSGSPPRVRGKAVWKDIKQAEAGITPACAGKSAFPEFEGNAVRDHPRVCGEKTFTVKNVPGAEGSPPRVRGKAMMPTNALIVRRITPACAGKSLVKMPFFKGGEDHPRVCGEKSWCLHL